MKDQIILVKEFILIIIYIHWFLNMKKLESMQTGDCSSCIQKDTLLHKYEQLMKLYKKKQLKLSGTSQSRLSNVLTSADSIPQDLRALRLHQILQNLTKKREIELFNTYKMRPSKKLALLSICNIIRNNTIKSSFYLLCRSGSNQVSEKDEELNTSASVNKSNIISGSQQYKDCQGDTLLPAKQRIDLIKSGLFQIKNSIKTPEQQRTLTQLEISNKILEAEINYLRKCLEESNRRQEKQNQKKKDSLEALAEDLNDKNIRIEELENELKAYEIKYGKSNNVLDDDPVALRAEVEHLQAIGDKLYNENYSLREKLQSNTLLIKKQSYKLQELENQNISLNNYKHQSQFHKTDIQIQKRSLDAIIQKLSQKFKKIKIMEQQLTQKHPIDKSVTSQTDSVKSEIILFYLANINLHNHELKCQHFFDEEERQFLMEHKMKYLQLEEQANKFNKSYLLDQFSQLQNVQGKGNNEDYHDKQHSIFSVIDEPKEKDVRGVMSDRQGITMKIIELELEKSKLVQRISGLKQKLMHIRVLFKNMLKSLQLQQGSLKSETAGVLRVIFDMYEYSEEERQQMFQKKKKLFGFI